MASFDLLAGACWAEQGVWVPDARLSVRGGKVVALASARKARNAARVLDFRPWVVVPGFVNAHAHLELSGLSLRRPRPGNLGSWIRELIESRASGALPQPGAAAAAGIARALASGTTAIGEIESAGESASALRASPMRALVFREILGLDPQRAKIVSQEAQRSLRRASSEALRFGLSPHAPYSLSQPLWRFAAAALRRGTPLSIHVAESRAEREMLLHGRGELLEALRDAEKLSADWRAPKKSSLDLLADRGLLHRKTLLVHGNDLRPAELDRVRRAGCSLVYCPGSHRFFRYPPYPLRDILRRGIPLALGTDSLASNEDLSMPREMALLRRAHPWISAESAISMATAAGARALGWEREIGRLRPGMQADFVVLSVRADRDARTTLDRVTSARPKALATFPKVLATFIRGRCAFQAREIVL